MSTKIPIYNCEIDDRDSLTGIYAMSFVDEPANESNFVALRKNVVHKLNVNKQKQVLTGVVLKPDQLIYREDESGEPFYIRFTAEQIERISYKMMRQGLALHNTTHQHEKGLTGNHLVELWTVADPLRDKSIALGLGKQPKGTLCASYKINNSRYWRDHVLTGNVRGFSIEGFFNQINIDMKKAKTALKKEDKPKKKGAFATFLTALLQLEDESTETVAEAEAVAEEAEKDETGSGEVLLAFELKDGNVIEVDGDGYATMDGEQAPAGSHELSDGNFITIDENGVFQVTQPETEGEQPEEPNTELKAALARGKALLEKTKKKGNPKDPKAEKAAEIAELRARLDKLEGKPSRKPAKPSDTKASATAKPLTHDQKIAAILSSQIKTK